MLVQVFGYTGLSEIIVTRGAQKVYAEPYVPLWAAGWCKPYQSFVPELAWHTNESLWLLQPYPTALMARMQDICNKDSLWLLQAGRRLGAVANDVRLRRAQSALGLTGGSLAVPADNPNSEAHRMRWLEVLDYLIGERAFRDTELLHSRLCMIENTASDQTFRRWAGSKAWSAEPGKMFLGDRHKSWQIDLCSEDRLCRVLASAGRENVVLQIRGERFSDLQDPRAGQIRIWILPNWEDMLERIGHLLEAASPRQLQMGILPGHTQGAGAGILDRHYQGGPIASYLLGLKVPYLRLRVGSLTSWKDLLALPREMPGRAFASFAYPPNHRAEALDPRWAEYICNHTLPGGLFGADFKGVATRSAQIPSRGTLYQPLSPYRLLS